MLFADRIRETTTTTGSGNLTVNGATVGFRAFSAVCAVGTAVPYVIQGSGAVASEFETGRGTYVGANEIRRDCVFVSSNGNNLVDLSAGTHFVSLDMTTKEIESIERLGYMGVFI